MIDFYFRTPGDPNYVEGITSSTNDLENVATQIRMTLLTKKGEVLGEPNFGFDPTKYLFEFEGFDMKPMEREANSQIEEYVMLSRIYDVRAEPFTLDDTTNLYRMSMGLSVSIQGTRSFATFYE
jgi:hypothetical protein